MDRAEYLADYCASIDCKNKKLVDCDLCMYEKGRADAINEFAKWLDEKGYLTHIEYDEDEDFDGNIIWSETEASLNADDVVVEYLEQLKEQKNG